MGIESYNETPSLNTGISGIQITEGMARSDVNNAFRQMMADLAVQNKNVNGLFSRGGVQSRLTTSIYDAFDRANQLIVGSQAPSGQTWAAVGTGSATSRIFNGEFRAGADTGASPTWVNNVYAYLDYGSAVPEISGQFKYSTGSGGNDRSFNVTTMIAAGNTDVVSASVHCEVSLDLVRLGYFFGTDASVSISGTTMTVTGATVNAFAVGTQISRHPSTGTQNILPFTTITSLGTGTGGNGTYTVDQSQTVTTTKAVAFNVLRELPVNLAKDVYHGIRMALDYTNNIVNLFAPGFDAPIAISAPGLSVMSPRYAQYQIRPDSSGLVGSWGAIGAGKSLATVARAASETTPMAAYAGTGATFRQPQPTGTSFTLTGAAGTKYRVLTQCPTNNSFAGFGIFCPRITITASSTGIKQIASFQLYCGSDGKPFFKPLAMIARPLQALSGAVLSWEEDAGAGEFFVALDLIKAVMPINPATGIAYDVTITMDIEGFATVPPTIAVSPTAYTNSTPIAFETVAFQQEQTITISGAAGYYTIAEQATYSGFGIAASLLIDAKTATRRNIIGIDASSIPITATVPTNWLAQTYCSDDNGLIIDKVRLTWEAGANPGVGENAKSQIQVYKTNGDTATVTMRSNGVVKLLSAPVAGTTLADGNTIMPLAVSRQIGSFVANGAVGDTTTYKRATTDLPFTIPDGVNCVLFTDAATVASGTITMPAIPLDGQEITIMGKATVTALTLAANTGQTTNSLPTTLTPTAPAKVRYHNNTPTSFDWYQV